MTEREFATDIVRRLQEAGHIAYWAGGCVRDELLGLVPHDYDVATTALPRQVQTLFKRCIPVGAEFLVIEVLGPRDANGDWLKVQVATFRSDGIYTGGRRPDSVEPTTPEQDALRRDFTINGLFLDPVTQQLYDYVDGQADLAKKVLRAIGKPRDRFDEDKLRILRAVRLAARFDLAIDPETLEAAQEMGPLIRVVSAERIADEMRKMLVHPRRTRAVQLFRDVGLIEPIFPELLPSLTERGPTADHVTEWEYLLRVMENLVAKPGHEIDFPLAMAVLLHRLDAPTTKANRETPALRICRRLKLANVETERILWLLHHQRSLLTLAEDPPHHWKPLLASPGIADLMAFHRALVLAQNLPIDSLELARERRATYPIEVLNPPPLITGDDLRTLGLSPGPRFKTILDTIRNAQLDGTITTTEAALAQVREMTCGSP